MEHVTITQKNAVADIKTPADRAVVYGKRYNQLVTDFDVINPSDGVLVGALTGNVTGDVTGQITSTLPGVLLAQTAGAGISGGTGTICRTYRRTEGSNIITTYHIDVTGLSCKGGNADDAIGTGTVPAYIDRVVTATHGIIYKIEMSCIELGTAASGTITNWIDLTAESAGTIDFDETAGTDQILDAVDAWVAGETIQNLAPTVTANDWLYLTEGDTAASTGVFASGQYIITLYGHALLT